jgi:uncharacterized membrane protein
LRYFKNHSLFLLIFKTFRTGLVLELKVPEESTLNSFLEISPVFISYLVSFLFVGIYWNSHHHIFQMAKKVNGKILWANLHFLFWLSLIPFATSWIGENYTQSRPAMIYGFILLMCSLSINILVNTIISHHDNGFSVKNFLGNRLKEKLSLIIYILGILLSCFLPFAGIICYVLVALMWIVPDKRIENNI